MFNIKRFLEDNRVSCVESGEWFNIACPFCKDTGKHLGLTENEGAHCWRCGKKKFNIVLKAILGDSSPLLTQTRERYGQRGKRSSRTNLEKQKRESLILPRGLLTEAPKMALDYLKSRNFDPKYLEEVWGIKYTGAFGDYKFRIITPIYHNEKLVSFQGRDYTGRSNLRYKACSKDNEVREHQQCLYGSWLVTNDTVVVVEGITDTWRLGPGAVATFGISFTIGQVELLSKYRKVVILFDYEEQAIKAAHELADQLRILNNEIDVSIVIMEGGDPAELPQEEADEFMREYGLKK